MPSDRFADQTPVSGRQFPADPPAVDVEDTDYGEIGAPISIESRLNFGRSSPGVGVNYQESGPFGQLDQRIVGGSASSFGQWPFIVGITR